jgi:Fe2+ transport system protein B
VVRAEGRFTFKENLFSLVDLPGTYSLLSNSVDEEIARDFILFEKPDVSVVVVDATSLERNLNLVLQVLEITDKVVICLNLMDEAERNGIQIDDAALQAELGVPVVPTAARRGTGLDRLVETIYDVASEKQIPCPVRPVLTDPSLEAAVAELLLRESENTTRSFLIRAGLLYG